MSEIPDTWVNTNLKTVANLVTGNTPSTKTPEYYGGSVPFVKPGDLDSAHPITVTAQQLTELGSQQSRLVRAGSTLVSCIGNLGKVGFAGVPLATNQQINSAEFHRGIVDDRYGYYLCKTLKPWMERESSATTISILNKGKFGEASFPLAPLPEQKRIADKLDTVLTRVDAVNTRLARVAPLLKRFRQSVLAAATSGRLTEDWRIGSTFEADALPLAEALTNDHLAVGGHERGNASEPTKEAHDLSVEQLPVGWQVVTMRDCCAPGRPITYGILKPGPELEVGVPYIRVADFPGNRLNVSNIKKTSPEIDQQYKRARLIGGDLLLSIRGSVGRLIEIPAALDGANITQDTARLSISQRLNSKYIFFALLAPDTQKRMSNAIRGVAVRGINIGDVRALQVPIPTEAEQTEIVRRVETLFAFADRLEARLAQAQTAATRLTPALLAKAFRGELVPQDPNDEPAAELLRRLQTQRATAPKASAGRGRKAAVQS